MPGYTVKKLDEVADVSGDYPGEMRMMAGDLGNEQVALTYRRMPQHTGGKGSYGHRHEEQEEVYFVISGKLLFKLDDEVIELGPGTAIRVGHEVFRSIWNEEAEDGQLIIVSTRLEDTKPEYKQDFWPFLWSAVSGVRRSPRTSGRW